MNFQYCITYHVYLYDKSFNYLSTVGSLVLDCLVQGLSNKSLACSVYSCTARYKLLLLMIKFLYI